MSFWSADSDFDAFDERECLPKRITMTCKDCATEFRVLVADVPSYWPLCEECFRRMVMEEWTRKEKLA